MRNLDGPMALVPPVRALHGTNPSLLPGGAGVFLATSAATSLSYVRRSPQEAWHATHEPRDDVPRSLRGWRIYGRMSGGVGRYAKGHERDARMHAPTLRKRVEMSYYPGMYDRAPGFLVSLRRCPCCPTGPPHTRRCRDPRIADKALVGPVYNDHIFFRNLGTWAALRHHVVGKALPLCLEC